MPSSVDLVAVDPSLVAEVWPHARSLVKTAIERTGLSNFASIEAEVLNGSQLLWLGWNGSTIEAAGTTQLVKIEGHKICVIVSFAANSPRSRWLPLLAVIENFAKAEGCKSVRLVGRKGWERILENYRANYVVMDKELA